MTPKTPADVLATVPLYAPDPTVPLYTPDPPYTPDPTVPLYTPDLMGGAARGGEVRVVEVRGWGIRHVSHTLICDAKLEPWPGSDGLCSRPCPHGIVFRTPDFPEVKAADILAGWEGC